MTEKDKEKLIDLVLKLKQSAIGFGVSNQLTNEMKSFIPWFYERDEKKMQEDTLNVINFINKIFEKDNK